MRQVQQQIASQKLALSQVMKGSLALLQMDAGGVAERAEAEVRRNPFMRLRKRAMSGALPGPGRSTESLVHADTAVEILQRQIGLMRLSTADGQLARDLVHCLDERGFLTDSLTDLSRLLNVGEPILRRTIGKLQSELEPTGVFARSLAECFQLQLIERNRFDPIIAALLGRLDLVASSDIDAICQHCQVDRDDAVDMLADIRALSPAPLASESGGMPVTRGPELSVSLNEAGQVVAALVPGALPELLVDDPMFSSVMLTETDGSARAYYKDCYGTAASFVMALQKRANTLLRIGQHVFDAQERFVKTGRPADRAPLTMTQTAQATGLHKSTVSRALAGCQVQSPHGILPADAFFARPVTASNTGKTRAQTLKQLDLLIRTEDKSNPLSDEALAALLDRRNFAISRRTVAKYRSLLGHPGASARRHCVLPDKG